MHPLTGPRRTSPRRRRVPVGVAVCVSVLAATTVSAAVSSAVSSAGPEQAVSRSSADRSVQHRTPLAQNPLAGGGWGVYKGDADQSWPPYVRSTGENRRLLAKISLRPKAKWFGRWISNADISKKVDQYIANSTGGNPDVLTQMTVFRMVPWEHEACTRLPTAAEQSSYKQWTNRFAAAIGSARVALVLQPDGPFALCAPGGSQLPSHLIRYAARTFSALPRTSVYIDAGASDWPKDRPAEAARILMPAGIQYARGFALNSTHYESTDHNVYFGTRLVNHLARLGVPGKHFVVNTAQNGRPFEFADARGAHPDNANTCSTGTSTSCVTLGIPPTARVGAASWGLTANNRVRARRHVDAYLWFGRPWLFMQSDPFSLPRALAIARTTPY
jgi:endoglucanase